MFILVLGIFIAFLIIMGVKGEIESKKRKEEQGITSEIDAKHIGGIPLLSEGVRVVIQTTEDKLNINNTHFLPLERIKRAQHLTEEQLVEKQKSIIKRAVVGGILLGPAAAVVGGMTGFGTKQTKKLEEFLSIDFVDKNQEPQTAVFHINAYSGADSFIEDVNQKIGYEEVKEEASSPTKETPYEI